MGAVGGLLGIATLPRSNGRGVEALAVHVAEIVETVDEIAASIAAGTVDTLEANLVLEFVVATLADPTIAVVLEVVPATGTTG